MRGIFDGTKTLFITANYVKDIIEAINFLIVLMLKGLLLLVEQTLGRLQRC